MRNGDEQSSNREIGYMSSDMKGGSVTSAKACSRAQLTLAWACWRSRAATEAGTPWVDMASEMAWWGGDGHSSTM